MKIRILLLAALYSLLATFGAAQTPPSIAKPVAHTPPARPAASARDTALAQPVDVTSFVIAKKLGTVPLVAAKIRLLQVNYQQSGYAFQLLDAAGKPLAQGAIFTLKVPKPSETTAIADITAGLAGKPQ